MGKFFLGFFKISCVARLAFTRKPWIWWESYPFRIQMLPKETGTRSFHVPWKPLVYRATRSLVLSRRRQNMNISTDHHSTISTTKVPQFPSLDNNVAPRASSPGSTAHHNARGSVVVDLDHKTRKFSTISKASEPGIYSIRCFFKI